MDKVVEEWEELKVEIQELQKLQENAVEARSVAKKKIEAELGDLLFTLCNLGYLLKVNPEDALRGTLVRFEKRFRHVEKKLKELGKTPEQSDLKEMDQFWSEAKNLEKFQVWGLTGGIAAGKSTVARFFEKAGIPVIDADQIARELSQPGGLAHERIEQCFGTTDPQVLREKIFTNPASKSELESILHPLIQEESSKRIQKLASQFPVVIYEAALLAETGRFKDLHGLIVIEAPQEDRLKRLLIRSGMTEEIAKRILSSQLPDSARAQNASVTIENRGSLEDLESKVQKWIQEQNWNMPQRSKI
jgi:dephospho-CoA kinase